ncbi:unnamed protein product [Caenorhabditis angaria]|uniref:Uncharacterized protein n=1 Tax=Caenorhabditis angaria TaxID=860376 RepID=A0A9P1N5B8_9PELO|nr:unnamed protein product [Caenorhabditis angaria]
MIVSDFKTNFEMRKFTVSKFVHLFKSFQQSFQFLLIDGRARILRPQPQISSSTPTMVATTTKNPTTNNNNNNIVRQVVKIVVPPSNLAPKQQVQIQRAIPTVSETMFAERCQTLLRRLRDKMKDLTSNVDRAVSTKKREQKERVLASCDEMKKAYSEIEKWGKMKIRRPVQYPQMVESFEKLEKFGENSPDSTNQFLQFSDSVNSEFQIEKQISQIFENFRQIYNAKPRKYSKLSPPKPFEKPQKCSNSQKMLKLSIEMMEKKLGNSTVPWKYEKIDEINGFSPKNCTVYQILYTEKKQFKEFVGFMKAVMVIQFGEMIDLVIGGVEEELYDEVSGVLGSKMSPNLRFLVENEPGKVFLSKNWSRNGPDGLF